VRRELAALLEELHRDGLRNLEPDSAALLALVVKAMRARATLELGTSNGYSTLWLADAARSVGGSVVSIELDAERSAQAASNLQQAGLADFVELRVQDGAEALRSSPDGAWQMILLDAERPAYAGYWPELVRVLAPGGLLAVDNVLSHAEEVEDFRALVSADERVSEALAPTGAGLLLIVRERA